MAGLGDRELWRAGLAVSAVGIELVISIAVGWWIGDSLDDWLGTAPWLTVTWVLIGAAAGFRGLWRTARRHWPRDPEDPA